MLFQLVCFLGISFCNSSTYFNTYSELNADSVLILWFSKSSKIIIAFAKSMYFLSGSETIWTSSSSYYDHFFDHIPYHYLHFPANFCRILNQLDLVFQKFQRIHSLSNQYHSIYWNKNCVSAISADITVHCSGNWFTNQHKGHNVICMHCFK